MTTKLAVIGGTDIAVEIGKQYRRGIEAWLECGRLLKIQRDALNHGQWGRWVEENRERLGFEIRTAQRLIDASGKYVASDAFDLWGHSKPILKKLGSGNNEWYTPEEYIEVAREALGDIDLDPASSDAAQKTVKARNYYTAKDNGLTKPWHGRVWLNPPYTQPLMGQFIDKLIAERNAKRVEAAILLTHSFTDTLWFQKTTMLCQAVCLSRGRIAFIDEHGVSFGASPAYGQAFFYFGPDADRFHTVFSANVGVVVWTDRKAAQPISTQPSNVAPVTPEMERNVKDLFLKQSQKALKARGFQRSLDYHRKTKTPASWPTRGGSK
jgi:phage N-6-adenine-methyltransferase